MRPQYTPLSRSPRRTSLCSADATVPNGYPRISFSASVFSVLSRRESCGGFRPLILSPIPVALAIPSSPHLRLLARRLVGRHRVHLKKSSSCPSTKKDAKPILDRRRDDVGRLEKTRELAFARQSDTSGRDVCEGVAVFRQMFSVVCTELSPRAGRRRAHRVIQRPTRTITPTSAAIATAPQVKIACGTTSELAAAIARKDNRARTKDFPEERPAARQTAERVDTVTVEAEETVMVPAGTFKTLKIVCRNKKTGLIP